jgi:hypothetical protein
MRLILCLFLAACASGPERQLERGTIARPPPAQARPGVGAPTYDPHVRPLPPQPQPKPERLLPPAREPGIWASNGPEWWTNREPTLLGVVLPYPPITAERDTWATRLCAARADAIREQIMRPDEASALTVKDRTCLAAKLYLFCVESMEANIAKDHASGDMKDHGLQAHLADVTAAAKRMKQMHCSEPEDPSLTGWLERFAKLWNRTQV